MSQLHAGPIRAGPLQLRDRHVRGGRRDALRLEHRLVRLPRPSQVALSALPQFRRRGAGLSRRDSSPRCRGISDPLITGPREPGPAAQFQMLMPFYRLLTMLYSPRRRIGRDEVGAGPHHSRFLSLGAEDGESGQLRQIGIAIPRRPPGQTFAPLRWNRVDSVACANEGPSNSGDRVGVVANGHRLT